MAQWAKRNGCPAGDTEHPITADVTRLTWNCPPTAAVELYRVTDGGHTWPGSPVSNSLSGIMGHTTMNVSANEIMWKFFLDHPLRPTK